eukprot:6665081-Prymnesium_polylepis.1
MQLALCSAGPPGELRAAARACRVESRARRVLSFVYAKGGCRGVHRCSLPSVHSITLSSCSHNRAS